MNLLLLNNDVQVFINEHLNHDIHGILLKGSPFHNISIHDLADQIESKKIAQKKFPSWFLETGVYYPKKIHLEQSSSEITAAFKADLVDGDSLLDLTGGFGVDTYYFAKKLKNLWHCEINPELSEVVGHNFKKMQLNNVTVLSYDGLEFLKNTERKFNWIFADPSRRDDQKNKVFLLHECTPDIPNNLNLLFEHTNHILIKLSPILDISAAVNELKFVKEIHTLAVDNEVKELLFLLEKGYSSLPKLSAVHIHKGKTDKLETVYNSTEKARYSLPKTYLYEPNAAILKAGLFNEVSSVYKVDKLHANSHLYTSREIVTFPGRSFKIAGVSVADKKKLLALIPSKKANITIRNFPSSVAEIRKKFGLKEGGDLYLFFTTNMENKHMVLLCEKIIH